MNPFEGLAKPLERRPGEVEKPPRRAKAAPSHAGWFYPYPNPWGLSGMECEILKRIAEGGTSKTIGTEFGLSYKTIDVHVWRATVKMGVSKRIQAVAMWVRHTAKGAA